MEKIKGAAKGQNLKKGGSTMTTPEMHKTGTHGAWLAARLELLKAEKELTRHSDEVARMRRELPWVRLEKGYRFDTESGSASLADLFRGHSQLLVYHFMFGPDFKTGCPSCSSIADGFNGIVTHLGNHDVMLWAVSRAPLAELQAYKRQKGWTFPWASSFGGDFNFDFNVSFTGEQLRDGAEYNFRRDDPVMEAGLGGRQIRGTSANATTTGTDVATYTHEREGMRTQALSASRGCAQRPVEHTHPRSSRCPCRECAMRSGRDRSQCHLGCALASVRRNAFRGRARSTILREGLHPEQAGWATLIPFRLRLKFGGRLRGA